MLWLKMPQCWGFLFMCLHPCCVYHPENSLSEGKPIQDDRNADRNRSHGGGKFGAGASRPGNEDYRTGGDGDDEMSDSTPPHPRNGSKTAGTIAS